jgi:protein-disulfide isomerase
MHQLTRLMITTLLLTASLFAQQKAQPAKAPAKGTTKAEAAKPAEEPKLAAGTKASLPSEATVMSFLKRMFGYDPNLVFRVTEIKESEAPGLAEAAAVVNTPQGQQMVKFYIAPDQKHAIMGDIIPFGTDPFADDRALLEKSAFGPTKGPSNAPVTIVEFGDLQCPACSKAQPNLEKLMSEVPNAKLIFQNFPLEQLHPWAMQAAKYLDCMGRANNDQAWTFTTAVYSHQAEITEANATEKLNNYAKMAGADPTAISACAAKPETSARVMKSQALGNQVKVTGTPTLFVNGRKLSNVGGTPYDVLKAIVEFEAQQKK